MTPCCPFFLVGFGALSAIVSIPVMSISCEELLFLGFESSFNAVASNFWSDELDGGVAKAILYLGAL